MKKRTYITRGLKLAVTASVLAMAWTAAPANAADVIRLKMAHFLPTANGLHSEFMEPWARQLEACSNGKVKVEIFPAGTQLGNIAKLHDEVRAGIVDIAHGLHGIPHGRFLRTRIVDLPFTFKSSDMATRTLWALYPKYLAEEYKGLKVLALHATNPGQIHTASKAVKVVEDMKGLRIRFPSGATRAMLGALGATPVGMPPGKVYENTQKGVIDGAAFTWDTMQSFKLSEVMKHHTDAKTYVVSFWFAMNEKKYKSLPENVRGCVDKLSGDNLIPKFGAWWNGWDKAGYDQLSGPDHEIITLNETERQKWIDALQPMIETQLAGLEKKGVSNAREIFKAMKDMAAKLDK